MKTNKSKNKPVSSWRCQRHEGAKKALQRVVWSLIFLGFGVHLVNAEEQGSQVQQNMSENDFYQIPQVDVPWRKRMLHWATCEGEKVEGTYCKKEIETARVWTQGPLKETAKVGSLVPQKKQPGRGAKKTDKKKNLEYRRSSWRKNAKGL